MSDWTPDPQEKGWLEPPRRNPPTAVGVATPPPPHRRRSHYHESRLKRAARACGMATIALSAGLTAGALAPLAVSIGIGAGLTGLGVVARVMRSRRRRRFGQPPLRRAA
jgi:hypothetical protein